MSARTDPKFKKPLFQISLIAFDPFFCSKIYFDISFSFNLPIFSFLNLDIFVKENYFVSSFYSKISHVIKYGIYF